MEHDSQKLIDADLPKRRRLFFVSMFFFVVGIMIALLEYHGDAKEISTATTDERSHTITLAPGETIKPVLHYGIDAEQIAQTIKPLPSYYETKPDMRTRKGRIPTAPEREQVYDVPVGDEYATVRLIGPEGTPKRMVIETVYALKSSWRGPSEREEAEKRMDDVARATGDQALQRSWPHGITRISMKPEGRNSLLRMTYDITDERIIEVITVNHSEARHRVLPGDFPG